MSFGTTLRDWRTSRRHSQLSLATEAGVSQRHLSFLETGRARPSREMVLHLSRVLDVPLRGRNDLLVAAGLAPEYPSHRIDDDAVAGVRTSLEFLLGAHEPNPAYVIDRLWNLVMANRAAQRLTPLLLGTDPGSNGPPNLLRLTLRPGGLRDAIVNFEEAAAAIVDRLARESRGDPTDRELADLLDEVLAYPGVPAPGTSPGPDGGLLVPIHYRTEDVDLRLFTTISVVGTPRDVTLDELRLETLLPADRTSAGTLERLAVGDG
ncbi:MAG TPA: helix-turn-helix transcriptional regulator [Acidimicrobiia bacterium]|nr:helix-turn-helix transcriptional regulator [Acidimicrobiia bacterium]